MGVCDVSIVVARLMVDIEADNIESIARVVCKSHVLPRLCISRNFRRHWHILHRPVKRE